MWKLYAGIGFIGAGLVVILSSTVLDFGRIFQFPLLSP